MTRYIVRYNETIVHEVEVDAKDEKAASQRAWDIYLGNAIIKDSEEMRMEIDSLGSEEIWIEEA